MKAGTHIKEPHFFADSLSRSKTSPKKCSAFVKNISPRRCGHFGGKKTSATDPQ